MPGSDAQLRYLCVWSECWRERGVRVSYEMMWRCVLLCLRLRLHAYQWWSINKLPPPSSFSLFTNAGTA